jgi:hypothetical protein
MPGVDFPPTPGASEEEVFNERLFGTEEAPATELGFGRNDGAAGFESKGLASVVTFR